MEKNVDNKYYLSERILPTILSNGTGGYRGKSEIDLKIARPLCATMAKMHRACQDNYGDQRKDYEKVYAFGIDFNYLLRNYKTIDTDLINNLCVVIEERIKEQTDEGADN